MSHPYHGSCFDCGQYHDSTKAHPKNVVKGSIYKFKDVYKGNTIRL